ncbi:MAG: NAD-dependent epimerase/dehydratase family protein [Actinobacteria bacterium]|nr:NAD-dependent epimerase/dehydratase family protein [Actinomycetota bacterium]
MTPWLITGAAGFIGFHVSARLLAEGETVVGLDNLTDYYDPLLKQTRLEQLSATSGFEFVKADLSDESALEQVFERHRPKVVVNLAAQAGVRYSLIDPMAYVRTNVVGFTNILERCRHFDVEHLVYASSSSIYGSTSRTPFSEHDPANHPVSVYAATKRADELLAHTYSHLFDLPTTGLRFFTVFGPWGRPDMAYYRFAEAILDEEPITIFGTGQALRDFTYIDDIVESVVRVAHRPAEPNPAWDLNAPDPGSSRWPWRVFNVGHGYQATVSRLIDVLEDVTGMTATRVHAPDQPGDVPVTHADVRDLEAHIGYTPHVELEEGLARFVSWLKAYRQ